ncbi:MAG TPA: hypothetical protein VF699_07510 [Caulobacteraceae bacterium]|jgi:hypothetical protein
MSYRIQGAQSFRVEVASAAEALTHARAAARRFPPIRIIGPQGELSIGQLEAQVQRERTSGGS